MRINIHYKITFVFTIVTTIILFGLFLYLNNSLKKHTYHRIKSTIIKETHLAKSFLEKYNLEKNNISTIDKIADEISSQIDVRVTIIDSQGKVELAPGVETVNVVESLGDLQVPLAAFGPQCSR